MLLHRIFNYLSSINRELIWSKRKRFWQKSLFVLPKMILNYIINDFARNVSLKTQESTNLIVTILPELRCNITDIMWVMISNHKRFIFEKSWIIINFFWRIKEIYFGTNFIAKILITFCPNYSKLHEKLSGTNRVIKRARKCHFNSNDHARIALQRHRYYTDYHQCQIINIISFINREIIWFFFGE